MLIQDRLIVFNMSSISVSHHPGLYLLAGHSNVVFIIIKDTIECVKFFHSKSFLVSVMYIISDL